MIDFCALADLLVQKWGHAKGFWANLMWTPVAFLAAFLTPICGYLFFGLIFPEAGVLAKIGSTIFVLTCVQVLSVPRQIKRMGE